MSIINPQNKNNYDEVIIKKNNELELYIDKKFTQDEIIYYNIGKSVVKIMKNYDSTVIDLIRTLYELDPISMKQFLDGQSGRIIYIPYLKNFESTCRDDEIRKIYKKTRNVKKIAEQFQLSQRRVYQILSKN